MRYFDLSLSYSISLLFLLPFISCNISVHSFEQLPILEGCFSNFPNFPNSPKTVFRFYMKGHFLIIFFRQKSVFSVFFGSPDDDGTEIVMCAFPKNTKDLNLEKSKYFMKLENWKTDFRKFKVWKQTNECSLNLSYFSFAGWWE